MWSPWNVSGTQSSQMEPSHCEAPSLCVPAYWRWHSGIKTVNSVSVSHIDHFNQRLLLMITCCPHMRLFVPIFRGCAWTKHFFTVIDSFRGTSRSQRDRRSQKWSYRSPFMEWRYWIPRQKWVLLFGRYNQIPTAERWDLLPKLIKPVNTERCGLWCFPGRAAQLSAPPDIFLCRRQNR